MSTELPVLPDLSLARDPEEPRLLWITLDRPEARNAYSLEMVDSLCRALDHAEAARDIWGVAITGAGSAFSAGGDLKAMRDHSGMFEGAPADLRARYMRGIQRVPRRLSRFDKPVVAAINGPAIGAGLDLACMCDLRLAVEGAKLGSTFVKVGLVPGDGGAYLLARTIGFPRALELVLSGRVIDAAEALGIGLVHAVVPAEELRAAARARMARILRNAPVAVRLAKQAALRSWDLPLDAALELAATYQGIAQNHPDHDEAVAAFFEKRRPDFTG